MITMKDGALIAQKLANQKSKSMTRNLGVFIQVQASQGHDLLFRGENLKTPVHVHKVPFESLDVIKIY